MRNTGQKALVLEARNIRKGFDGREVLKGVDLTVARGDVIAVLGPSGSGKTTLLRCLNFLERADGGTLRFQGKTYELAAAGRREAAEVRRKTAFVFQNYNLFLNKTVLQNVTLGLTAGAHMEKSAARDRAMAALERVGMADRTDSYPSQLSGGQQQRVAIARGLAGDPEIIFFDEPTSALDPELIGEVLTVMRSLAEDGMTMVVVTHELSFARSVSSQALFMENGAVVESGSAERFFAAPQEARTRAFLSSLHTGRE